MNLLTSVRRGFLLFGLSLVQLLAWTWVIATATLCLVGVGLFLLPGAIAAQRFFAERARALVRDWHGLDLPSPYPPEPPAGTGVTGAFARCRFLLTDPATRRDLLWGITDPVVGGFLALLAACLPLYAVEGLLMPVLADLMDQYGLNEWYLGVPVGDGWPDETRWLCMALGAGLLYYSLSWTPKLLRVHADWTRSLLRPGPEALERRVRHLSATRAQAVDASAAELRRIERDLHDGAQARLVAMGMSLGTVEYLLEHDPAKARLLLAEVRENSLRALNELRDLVRGMHPPVLADRGLGDAVRALALDSGLVVTVEGGTPRFQPPIEAAAYFAICELLANAAKHAAATEVRVALGHADGRLSVSVTDDGVGGASLDGDGTGLRGIERRLEVFDGEFALESPEGGPTVVSFTLPCAPVGER